MTEHEAMEVLVTLKGTGAINGEEIEAIDVIDEAILELEKYRTIGTPEECRAAVEKQKAKKPNKCISFTKSLFVCPACGRKQPIMYEQYYCKECGQKLDWSDEE